jgi:hypothetical protein
VFCLKAFRIAAYCALALEILAVPFIGARAQQVDDPGPAAISASDVGFRLENRVIAATVSIRDGKLSGLVITDHLHGTPIPVSYPFAILFKDGSIWHADDLTASLQPHVTRTVPLPDASRASDKIASAVIEIPLESADHALHVVWSIVLRDGSTYLRQFLEIGAIGQDAPISRIQLIDLALPDAHVSGSVEGSPMVAGNLFLGFEHPLSHSKVTGGRATAWIDRDLPLRAGQTIVYSSVIGVAHEGQMRRDFLAYLERERAHPYRTFLHYNSWYDLGYFSPYDQTKALDRVNTFGRELTEKRGVKLDSFLFDDGWDNHKSLWNFNDGFPNGFMPIREVAAKFGARPGVWMSPWGGYDGPKQERIAFGKDAGYEIIDGGYALSGPKYYTAFRDVCLSMVRDYGVNQFKFDGTGNADSVFPGSQFDSDFSAAIHLIGELRAAKPDVFINLTTGTWPSPFWLLYADSIWRGGDDDSTAGVGPYRERWTTYRDAETYRRVVQNGPFYPLNSLMLHGLIFAQDHKQLDKDPSSDFRNEIRSYFGTGTQLQEMYITPSLLSQSNWDDLAEAANWSRANADVLKDTHWVCGDPSWLEVYGWASWSPRKGILVLRNPSDHAQDIGIKLQQVFELPVNAAQVYHAQSPWKDDAGRRAIVLHANEAHVFHLASFEVLTLDILPGDSAH